jgi:hypothetical protein
MCDKLDLVKTIEDDDDVPDFSENSDEEEEVCRIFLDATGFLVTHVFFCFYHFVGSIEQEITYMGPMCFSCLVIGWSPTCYYCVLYKDISVG